MSKSPPVYLEPVQTYLSKKELKSLDKIANTITRSRSDTVRLLVVENMKNYAKDLNLKL